VYAAARTRARMRMKETLDMARKETDDTAVINLTTIYVDYIVALVTFYQQQQTTTLHLCVSLHLSTASASACAETLLGLY